MAHCDGLCDTVSHSSQELLMKPFSVSVSTTVERPVQDVQALLDDLSAHERWTDHFLVDWELLTDPHGVGAKVRLRAKGGGRHPWAEIEVVESTPQRIVEHGRGGKDLERRTTGTYELRPAGPGRTEVTFTNTVESATRADALTAPLAKAYLRRQNARALERLRALLEAQTPAA